MPAPIEAVADPCFIAPLCNFLADHKWFLDGFHLYDFFTKGVWDRFANKEWAEFVDFHCKNPGANETAFIDLLIDVVLGGEVPEDWPATFKKFVELTRTLSLDRRVSVDKDLHLELPINYDEKDCTLAALSRKKLHEIDRLARVVHTLVERHNADAIMDAGAGTGYLTHLVALQNPGAQVYAIDSDASRTVGSKDRAKRMLASSAHRYPPSILEGAVRSHAVPASPVQHSTGLVDVSTIRRCAGDRAILTGLHCCGDLGGRTMIEAFEQCESVKALCVVGCCYQRIYVGGDEAGFPLSSSIRTALDTSSCALNTRSLSTACFSFSSFPDRAAIRSSLHGHTNRALLEHLLAAHVPLRVGSVPAHAHVSFESYAHAAAKKLGLLTEELGQRITAMENMRRGSEGRIAFCVAVRSLMGSVVEALVIADRVARIREIPGVERVIARNLFDAALSPRNVVIIGEKAVGKKT